MTTHRRYTFVHSPAESDWAVRVVGKLTRAADDYWWFADPEVDLVADELTFSIVVTGRDQWFAHKRVMALAEDICWPLKIPVPVPVWEVLPPHTNRGRYRTVPASEGAGAG